MMTLPMNPSRCIRPVVIRNMIRHVRPTAHQRYPAAVRYNRTGMITIQPYPLPVSLPLHQQYHHDHHRHHPKQQQQQQMFYSSLQNGTPPQLTPIQPIPSLSAVTTTTTTTSTESNNIVTTFPPTVPVATTINATGEESILKEPPSTTTTTTIEFGTTKNVKFLASEQKPRPIFPWRHDIEPIPRLIPGTKEFIEARTSLYQDPSYKTWNERFNAYYILQIPISTVLLSFNRWKQTIAYDGMYAFTKGVAGIVANTYRIPVDHVSSEVKDLDIISFVEDDDDDEDADTTPMVHFNYPPDEDQMDPTTLNKEFNDEIMSILNEVFNIDTDDKENDENQETKQSIQKSVKSSDTSQTAKTNQNSDDITKDESLLHHDEGGVQPTATTEHSNTTASDPSNGTSNISDKAFVNDELTTPELASVETTDTATQDTSNPSKHVSETNDTIEVSSSLRENKVNEELPPPVLVQRHPAFQRPYQPKSYHTNDKSQIPSSSSTPNNKEDDEFCSNISNMMIEPLRKLYQSAHESGREQLKIKLHMRPIDAKFISLVAYPNISRTDGPEKIKVLREMVAQGFNVVLDFLMAEMTEGKSVQTTIEMQLWITCLESFQVIDSESGVLLQGSEDGLPQEVTHIVRFERTIEVGRDLNSSKDDGWVITDIDDMLGHKAWYIVENEKRKSKVS